MTDYESIFRSQLEEMDFSGMEDILEAADLPQEITQSFSVKEIIANMLSGDAAISQESVFAVIKALFFGELREFGVLAAELICICIIAGLLSSFTSGFGSGTASGMSSVICSFAAAGICMTAFYQLYQLGIQSVSLMTTLMGASLPVIFAVTAVSGGAASATVLSSVISAAVTAFSAFVRYVLMPVVFVSGIFTVANSVGRRSYIGKTAAFLRSAALFGMGAAITLFTGLSVIQGMMTKSADDLLMKTARYSIDNLIPFVGGFAADSLEMIVTCIRSIRGGIGIAGVILLILLLAGPLIKSVCIILIFRVTSLVLEPAGSDSMSDCMGDLASAASVLTALLFLSSVMFIIFFTCVLRFAPSL